MMVYGKYVRDDVVHFGYRVDTEYRGGREPVVYLLCEKAQAFAAAYGARGSSCLYRLGVEAFHVFDDVDCMTCLVTEAVRSSRP